MNPDAPQFLLQRLRLEPTYTETSATEVKWLDAIRETVSFVPWDTFDGIIARTQKKLEKVDERFLNSAQLILGVNSADSAQEHDHDSREGSTVLGESEPSVENVFNLAYMVDVFTDSTSTDGLNDNVFRATALLLRGLHRQKDLRFVNRGYSSHLGMEFDAIGKHLPHHVTIRPYRILDIRPGATLERLPIRTFEWKGPGLDLTCMGGDSGKGSDERMKLLLSEAVRVKTGDIATGKQIFFGNVSSTATTNDSDTANSSSANREERLNIIQEASNESLQPVDATHANREHTTPSEHSELTDETPTVRKKTVEEIVGELIGTDSKFESLISASMMSTFLGFLFEERNTSKACNQSMKFGRLTRIAVAQAISQGVLSESGCFFLSTYVMGLAFEIRGLDKNNKVIVAVSRPFHCHIRPGLVHPILSLASYAVAKLKDGSIEIASGVRKCADVVSTSAYNLSSERTTTLERSATTPGTGSNEAITGSSSTGDKEVGSQRSASVPYEEHNTQNAYHESESEKHKSFTEDTPNDITTLGSPVTFFEDCEYKNEEGTGDLNERIKAMFETCTRVLAVGGSGIILEGYWNGSRVAIKTWSGGKTEGKQSIAAEVDMYLHIEQFIPSILCVAIPRVFLGLNAQKQHEGSAYIGESILVTELIGNRV